MSHDHFKLSLAYHKILISTKNSCHCIVFLTNRGTEYYGKAESHDYPHYLAINDIDLTMAKARSPQINGICERLHRKILIEFSGDILKKDLHGH
jgi:transposase InsO family protein